MTQQATGNGPVASTTSECGLRDSVCEANRSTGRPSVTETTRARAGDPNACGAECDKSIISSDGATGKHSTASLGSVNEGCTLLYDGAGSITSGEADAFDLGRSHTLEHAGAVQENGHKAISSSCERNDTSVQSRTSGQTDKSHVGSLRGAVKVEIPDADKHATERHSKTDDTVQELLSDTHDLLERGRQPSEAGGSARRSDAETGKNTAQTLQDTHEPVQETVKSTDKSEAESLPIVNKTANLSSQAELRRQFLSGSSAGDKKAPPVAIPSEAVFHDGEYADKGHEQKTKHLDKHYVPLKHSEPKTETTIANIKKATVEPSASLYSISQEPASPCPVETIESPPLAIQGQIELLLRESTEETAGAVADHSAKRREASSGCSNTLNAVANQRNSQDGSQRAPTTTRSMSDTHFFKNGTLTCQTSATKIVKSNVMCTHDGTNDDASAPQQFSNEALTGDITDNDSSSLIATKKISWGKAKSYPGSETVSELDDDKSGSRIDIRERRRPSVDYSGPSCRDSSSQRRSPSKDLKKPSNRETSRSPSRSDKRRR